MSDFRHECINKKHNTLQKLDQLMIKCRSHIEFKAHLEMESDNPADLCECATSKKSLLKYEALLVDEFQEIMQTNFILTSDADIF